ncbi:hypothetical protein A9R05_42930 (plasmid) [Burkholderia sp. KK1]|uniref:hypothetical protein n=1 Tax=Burkholderia sp. M701 TaxID=326454 RepID=UPI000979AF8D|nr:hypothetical protein [Burkholderia sp. M701]AQH05775.1 hypothetical protein A9R05_42930 [Burkholderia sp. KK1]
MKKTLSVICLFLATLSIPTLSFAYGYAHGYAHHSGAGWFGTMVAGALIHAVIYGLVFKVFHAIGLIPSLLLGGVILFFVYRQTRSRM